MRPSPGVSAGCRRGRADPHQGSTGQPQAPQGALTSKGSHGGAGRPLRTSRARARRPQTPWGLDLASVPPNTSSVTLNDLTGVGIGSYLACLGSWTRTTYSVANGNLLANGTPVVAGILALKAQYGVAATPNSNTVAAWVDAGTAPWNAPTSAERDRIKAVRLALVARNAHYERDLVSNACSSTTADAPTGLCAWAGSAASPARVSSTRRQSSPKSVSPSVRKASAVRLRSSTACR